jgi:hypothetical protein
MLTAIVATSLTLVAGGLEPDPYAAGAAEFPPMTVHVHTAPSVSPLLLDKTLDEAAAVWRPTGVTFHWKTIAGLPREEPDQVTPRVIIADQKGQTPKQGGAPLGWVNFRDEEPDQEIHISRTNAAEMLRLTRGPTRPIERMTPLEGSVILGRILGRALAHELGHYLLKTRSHTSAGLMRGRRPVQEFYAPARRGFEVDGAQRQAVAKRIIGAPGAG